MCKTLERCWNKWSDKHNGIVIALATLALVFVTYSLITTTREQMKAYLEVKTPIFEFYDNRGNIKNKDEIKTLKDIAYAEFKLELINHGLLPARLVNIEVNITDENGEVKYAINEEGRGSVFKEKHIPIPTRFTGEEMYALEKNDKKFFMIEAIIKYKTGAGNEIFEEPMRSGCKVRNFNFICPDDTEF